MPTQRIRERRGEGGVGTVEFALVAMIVFMFFFGLVDISITEIGNTAATNAVRAGARAGALSPEGADVEGSPSYNKIRAAVVARLAGVVTLDNTFDLDGIDVSCIDGTNGVTARGEVTTTNPSGTSVSSTCIGTTVPIVPERDRLRVTLRWVHRGISPFITSKTKTESATVAIVGSGAVLVAPTDCKITGSTTNTSFPSIGSASPSGPLTATLTVTAATNGLCPNGMTAVVFTGTETAGAPTLPTKLTMASVASSSSFQGTFPSSVNWMLGEKTIRFTNGLDGTSEIAYSAVNANVTVVSDVACAFIAAGSNPPSNNPPSVRLQSTVDGTNPSQTSVLRSTDTITVWAVGTARCATETVVMTYTRALPGTERHDAWSTRGASASASCGGVTSGQVGICFTWLVPTSLQWNLGLKTFSFDDDGANGSGVTAGWPGEVASVQVNQAPPACTISVRFHDTSTYTTFLDPVRVDEKGTQGLGRLRTAIYVRVTQEFESTCAGPIYVQWDRGRGFGSSNTPTPCAMTAGTGGTHSFTALVGESLASLPSTSCTSNVGSNKVWLPTGQVTFRFWNGNPSITTTPQLTPLTPASITILEA